MKLCLERSADWPRGVVALKVREVHRRVVNFEGPAGRRFSFVLSPEDFGPRTALVVLLPPVSPEGKILVDFSEAPRGYAPFLPALSVRPRWRPLWREWPGFLDDEELKVVGKVLAEEGWSALVGLGPGSTPAGDDVICGAVLAFRMARRDLPQWAAPAVFERTTWLSAQIVRDAAEGLVWRRTKTLLEALCGDDGDAVRAAAGAVIDWGHSSGRALLAGLALGLEEIRPG